MQQNNRHSKRHLQVSLSNDLPWLQFQFCSSATQRTWRWLEISGLSRGGKSYGILASTNEVDWLLESSLTGSCLETGTTAEFVEEEEDEFWLKRSESVNNQ